MTIHAEYPTPKGERMNAIDQMSGVVEKAKGKGFDSATEFRRCLDAALSRIEREYMELPKDADGVPCRPGSKLYTNQGTEIIVDLGSFHRITDTTGRTWMASSLSHVKPDSWEQIEADAGETGSMALKLVRRCKALSERGA